MKVADLRHLVEVQSRTQVADSMGSHTGVWSAVYQTWAGVWPVSAKERAKDGGLTMEITHKIRIRYRAGITPGMRIVHDSRNFDILSTINPDERNITLDLICREDV